MGDGGMLLASLVSSSESVAATSGRLGKIELLAGALRSAGPGEVPIAVAYLSGDLPQRQIGVGWATLRGGFPAAASASLTLRAVDAAFAAIGDVSGPDSVERRGALVADLFALATAA